MSEIENLETHLEWAKMVYDRDADKYERASLEGMIVPLPMNHETLGAMLAHIDAQAAEIKRLSGLLSNYIPQLAKLQQDNTYLRAALAVSKDPCIYCQLPADEMAKCSSGFPGCSRADDAVGCPELGASLELREAKAQLAKYRAACEAITATPKVEGGLTLVSTSAYKKLCVTMNELESALAADGERG